MKKRFLAPLLLTILFSCKENNQKVPNDFEIHPDFHLELVAIEPLVIDPVELKFDELGRAVVLEMPGYPMSDAESRLVLLQDTDDDGIYDRRKVYCDSLGVATSFLPYGGGFLVAAPPFLLWVGDENGDNKADQRKVLMDGFSQGNLQHNFNGLTYGVDNWIYAANGGNSGKPYFVDKTEEVLELRGTDFKFHLENKALERVGESSGGYKITFDNWGRLFETHNLEHVSHLVFEDKYLESLPLRPSHALTNISDHEENGLSRVYPIGEQHSRVNHPEQSGYFSGACGITHYGGGVFPKEFNSCILVADCVLNLVHLDLLSQERASFSTKRNRPKNEFLASKDRSFRPVNMTVGPNGALYVVDMHRDVIEHPEWIPDELEDGMDLNAGKDKGRIYRVIPKGAKLPKVEPFPLKDVEALVALLGSPNQWKRISAQRVLVTGKYHDAIPFLENLLKDLKNPMARLHSMWTLEGLDVLDQHHLVDALADPIPGIRENALRITEKRIGNNPKLLNLVLELTKDVDARVRMQASLTLIGLDKSHYLDNKNQIAEAMALLLNRPDNDEWIIKSTASALQYQALDFVLGSLKGQTTKAGPNLTLVQEILTEFLGKEKDLEKMAQILQILAKNEVAASKTPILIEAMARGLEKNIPVPDLNSPEKWLSLLEPLEQGGKLSLLKSSGKLRKVLGLPASRQIHALVQNASSSLFNAQRPVAERLELLQLLGLEDFEKRENLLYRLLENRQPIRLQEEALLQLWNSNDPKIAQNLLGLWPNLGPRARKHATDILLYKSAHHPTLLTAMENGRVNLGEFNLDLERRRILLFSDDNAVRDRARILFSDAGIVQRKEAISKMRPALTLAGDADKGSEVFTTVCAQCHVYGNLGNDVGPVLTEINRKSKESLLHDILDPNAAVDTKYLNHRVETKDGTIYTGIVVMETDTELGLRMVGGNEKTILKNDISHFSSTGSSMMYEGLESNISTKEMADLLAFLQQ